MRKGFWVALTALFIVAMGASAPGSAMLTSGCQSTTCTRDFNCLVECPSCNGSIGNPGTCWWFE